MGLKQTASRYLSNIPGWSTSRKIIVIESDDWGSLYMSTPKALQELTRKGFDFSKSHYLNNDTIESNQDMEMLFDVLSKHKDKTDRSAVVTGVGVVANPNFAKIKKNGFSKYEFESFVETCQRYDNRDKVHQLWKDGIKNRLMVPIFHGREHLNVQRWMKLLQSKSPSALMAFDYEVTAFRRGLNQEVMPDLRAAFDIDTPQDIEYLKEVITSGLDLFETIYGFRSQYFIPTNGPFNNSLEPLLKECGIKYIGTPKIQHEPIGNNAYRKHIRFIGNKNQSGQTYLTRNCFFEPNSWEHSSNKDWVNDCLKEIEIAFRCFKPAIISSHRTNYTGSLQPQNRESGLKKLDLLLKTILQKWPSVEFMTSEELGHLISQHHV